MLRHTLHSPQRGMSLVELLVATVISLLGVLIIFQVFAVNEDVRRATTSGSDEQTSGLMALMAL
jgi:prepilin-type N-terminal cleavage/methylation domain-containing protein